MIPAVKEEITSFLDTEFNKEPERA